MHLTDRGRMRSAIIGAVAVVAVSSLATSAAYAGDWRHPSQSPLARPPASRPTPSATPATLSPAGGAAAATTPLAAGFVYPAPGQRRAGGGRLPASASGSEYLG